MKLSRRARITELQGLVNSARSGGGSVVRVKSIRQRARTGTKCYIEHLNGTTEAAWFRASQPSVGQILIVHGGHGNGQHHHERVFYVTAVSSEIPRYLWSVRRRLDRS